MRLTLGAGRMRLVRQLLTESVILFMVAGSLRLLLIHWFTRVLATGWGPLPAASDVTIDAWVVAFCDSAGLELLVDLATELRDEGGSLQLANPNPLCREVLAITRLDETIPIHEDLESAGRSFL